MSIGYQSLQKGEDRNSEVGDGSDSLVRFGRAARQLHPQVDDYGTITETNFEEPKINGEIFDVLIHMLTTPEDIIFEVENCGALLNHFQARR